jgi:hypothetical protein
LRDEILQTWGADEGEAAARWVQKLSSPEEALQAGSIAMEAWLGDSKTPLPQISAWLTAQKSGPVKDIGLEKLAVALEPTFPIQATIAALKNSRPPAHAGHFDKSLAGLERTGSPWLENVAQQPPRGAEIYRQVAPLDQTCPHLRSRISVAGAKLLINSA